MSEFPASLQRWLQSPLAQSLIEAEAQLLTEAFDNAYGPELLQLGPWGACRKLLTASRNRRQSVLARAAVPGYVDVQARLSQLPVAAGSIDVVLLPHTLEWSSDPQAVLREADRVLVGEGQIIVLGFAPLGPWGLRSLCSRGGFPPGLKRLLSERRLRDWLGVLGFEVAAPRPYLYRWPLQSNGGEGGSAPMLRRGLFNPWPAGAYLLKARKRIYGMTPLRQRWREQRRGVLGGLVEPST
ncbi:MAG: class I SAM-dependent methyltransferase [Steroidobacteraceae bacterium]